MSLTLGTKTLIAIENLNKAGVPAKMIQRQSPKSNVEIAVARLWNEDVQISVTSKTLKATGEVSAEVLKELEVLHRYNKAQVKFQTEWDSEN